MPQKSDFYPREALYAQGGPLLYEGERLNEIAFPLGGIGAGCVSLNGRGALVDWEIFNRPNKGAILPYAFTVLWAKAEGQAPVVRVVQAPPRPPFSGQGKVEFSGIGFGVQREDGSGFPHLRTAIFRGEFPLAEITFTDPALPVQVRLEAYSPFIPMDADRSGMPIAVLRYHIANPGPAPVAVSLAANLKNIIGYPGHGPMVGREARKWLGGNLNTFVEKGGVRGLFFTSERVAPGDPSFGTMALTTTWPEVWHQCAWLRGGWFDMMHDYWDHLAESGRLPERAYGPSAEGESDVGTLGLTAHLEPGEEVTLPIFITWHFPTFIKYWGEPSCPCQEGCERPTWRNYYATLWEDALDVAQRYAAQEAYLYGETRRFHDALFGSTLPRAVVDALSSQASILHSPTVLRLEDGTFYGWEGCHAESGCCEGTCTHVWNYAQTVAFLFPALERSQREADYRYNMRPDGRMGFRLQLPLGSPPWEFHPAADGQMGGILKTYRDWKLCGDDEWLRRLWPSVKKALEYAWIAWDADRDGVMEGIQHNTYDIEFVGPNTMTGTWYLGALRAAEEMARYLGDLEAAEAYRATFEKGRARIEAELYNGEYYIQKVDLATAPKYQYGTGCLSDHLIGQWFAHLVGLGYLLEPEHVQSALQAIFRHNWRTDFWEHANPQRIYALNDEQGLLLCTWPRGGRPAFPFVYSDEVWCGIEYQVASHLIYEGFVQEGLTIVQGVRARHDGARRNPWNEFECGSHYARSLASWSLLTALSGFRFDRPKGFLGFAPRLWAEDFTCFWSVDGAWGLYRQGAREARLEILYGQVSLRRLELGQLAFVPSHAWVGEQAVGQVEVSAQGAAVTLPGGVMLRAGEGLVVR